MASHSSALVDRLLAISRALAGHIDPGAAFRATAAEIGKLIPHDHMDIVVLLHGGRNHACYEANFRTAWSELARHPRPAELSPVRTVFRGVAPYLITANALSDERFHFAGALDEPMFAAELRSRIIVPLRARGDIVGTLNISQHGIDRYAAPDVNNAQRCADFLAPYIFALIQTEEVRRVMLSESEARNREELLRVGASKLTEGMETERRRMGMDLHDQTLADLARVSRQVSSLRSQGMATSDQLSDLEGEIASCLMELRRIVDDMRPTVLELFGLRDAVEAHLIRSVGNANPPISFHVADTSNGDADDLSEPTRTALYRIVQEAINNAVRHALPNNIDVQIESTRRELRVVVTDDGRGCDHVNPATSGGIGHMRTRAALINARLHIRRADHKRGTRVAITMRRKSLREQTVATIGSQESGDR
jgi:signal transduction histidine kinase